MSNIDRLLDIMRRLRDPETGCPWDREQTWQSLVPHTLEEAYEVAEAIEQQDYDQLPDELGDLLFQIVFYARLGEESGRFDFDTVVARICDKLVRRHPHVFGEARVRDAAEQSRAWEDHKQREREARGAAGRGVLHGVSRTLPALSRAAKLQRRAARVGFDWPDARGVLAKIREELAEVEAELAPGPEQAVDTSRLQEEIGDLLFSVVNLARHLAIDPEAALRAANRKFEHRFARVEQALADQGGVEQASLDAMEAAWQAAKQQE
jgi:MazG family protein